MPYVHIFIVILTLNYQNSIWLFMCLVTQLCPTLCDPMDCCLPGSSAGGLFQARILEWGAISTLEDLSDPRIKLSSLASPAMEGGFFTTSTTWQSESHSVVSNSLQPHGLYSPQNLQARILEWVAFPFSRRSSQPRD